MHSARVALGGTRVRVVATCLAAGVLLAASLPPWGWWPLAFIGVVLTDRVLDGVAWRGRLARGSIVGFALVGPTMAWLKELTFPGYLIAVALFSALIGAFVALVPPGAGRRLALPGAWVLAEALRTVWPFGGVPLSVLATGQVAGPLAGVARLGGTLLVGVVTVTIGVGLAAAVRRQWLVAVAALAAVVTVSAVAHVAPRGHDTGRRLDVAFVQGGGPQGTRAINTDPRKVFRRHLDASAGVPKRLDLVLWPEDVVDTDGPVLRFREGAELRALARRLETNLVVGTVESVGSDRFRNSVQVFRDGVVIDRYEKVHRVPFGEYVPFRSLLEKVAGGALPERDAIPGTRPPVVHTSAGRIAVMISWEVFFGDRARSGVDQGGQLLINPTNGSTYTRTLVQSQQLAASRLRAIETGRWEVQVAPTGFSAFVTPTGGVLQRTSVSEQAVRVQRGVALRTGRTLYVRAGDDPTRVLALLLVGGGWLVDRRRRTPGAAEVTHGPRPSRPT